MPNPEEAAKDMIRGGIVHSIRSREDREEVEQIKEQYLNSPTHGQTKVCLCAWRKVRLFSLSLSLSSFIKSASGLPIPFQSDSSQERVRARGERKSK